MPEVVTGEPNVKIGVVDRSVRFTLVTVPDETDVDTATLFTYNPCALIVPAPLRPPVAEPATTPPLYDHVQSGGGKYPTLCASAAALTASATPMRKPRIVFAFILEPMR